MDLRLVTVRLDPETAMFPESPLAEIAGEVVHVVEHFFHYDGVPQLLLVVHLRESSERTVGSQKRERIDAAATLDESERDLYERLRAWRNGRAQTDGVPPYVILTNALLAMVARQRPNSLAALQSIRGLGGGTCTRYGAAIIEVIGSQGMNTGLAP